MNIKGMKNILREVDKELMVLLYDTDDKELFRKPLPFPHHNHDTQAVLLGGFLLENLLQSLKSLFQSKSFGLS